MKSASRKVVLLLIALLAASDLPGCQPTARDLSLDLPAARLACESALLAWQDGRIPADLKPDIIVSDYQWSAGQKLTAYEFLPDEEFNDGTNLHIHVRLSLEGKAGRKSTTNAQYVVGTDPVVTVIRD